VPRESNLSTPALFETGPKGCNGTLGELSDAALQDLLRDGRLVLRTGPLTAAIESNLPDIGPYLKAVYRHHPYLVDADFADFHVQVRLPRNLRRWMRRQAEFLIDEESPFEPLPRDQAPALLEWGLNWSIAASCHQWLAIHAASLERDGAVVILPAPPGSGKSTLCAALALRGWRLLSDELTLLDPQTLEAHALARPINLKNASIDLIKAFEPSAHWGPLSFDTIKGRVAHLCPPRESVQRMMEVASPRWIVFPKYVQDAEPLLTRRSKVQTFTHFAENAFNYSILGELGFAAVGKLIDQCDCYDFVYSQLDDALEVFDWLAAPDATLDSP
jgi:HprK-related kinase A